MRRPLQIGIAFLALLFLPAAAGAQSAVLSTQPWAARHAPMYIGQGSSQAIVQDSGPAGGGGIGLGLSEQLLTVPQGSTQNGPWANSGTGPYGTNLCDYDNWTTASGGYHYFCISPNAQGGALIAIGAVGAAPQPLSVIVNGITYPFPGGLSQITLGTTPVVGGTPSNCLVVTTGNVVGEQNCAPAAITALTGDVAAAGPGSVAATLATVNPNVGTFGSAAAVPTITVNGKGLVTAVTQNAIPIATLLSKGLSTVDGSTLVVNSGVYSVAPGLGAPCSTTPSSVQFEASGGFGCVSGATSNGTAITFATGDLYINAGSTTAGFATVTSSGQISSAAYSSITTVGALSSGSIASGFGSILVNNTISGNAIYAGTTSSATNVGFGLAGSTKTGIYATAVDSNMGWSINGTDKLDYGITTPGIFTLAAPVAISSSSFGLSGNISSAAWTTNGVRYTNAAATLTDTTSNGTVAAAYTDLWGGNTIAAASSVTYTNYFGSYFKAPVAGTNVTFTHGYALGADSLDTTTLAIGGTSITTSVSATQYGAVKIDNSTIQVNGSGQIYASGSSATAVTALTTNIAGSFTSGDLLGSTSSGCSSSTPCLSDSGIAPSSLRTKLSGNVTYELSMAGSDSNNCSTSAPCLTWAHLWGVLTALDLNGYTVTVEIAGTSGSPYTYCIGVTSALVGQTAPIVFTSTTGTAYIKPSSGNCSGAYLYAISNQGMGSTISIQNIEGDMTGTYSSAMFANGPGSIMYINSGVIAGPQGSGYDHFQNQGQMVFNTGWETNSSAAQTEIDNGQGGQIQVETNGYPYFVLTCAQATAYGVGFYSGAQNSGAQLQAIWPQGSCGSDTGLPFRLYGNASITTFSVSQGQPTNSFAWSMGVPYLPGTLYTTTATTTANSRTITVGSTTNMAAGQALNGYNVLTNVGTTAGSNVITTTNASSAFIGAVISSTAYANSPGCVVTSAVLSTSLTLSPATQCEATASGSNETVGFTGYGIPPGCWIYEVVSSTTVTLNPGCLIPASLSIDIAYGGLYMPFGLN